MISGIAHINLTVPSASHTPVSAFYTSTLGLTPRPVPAAQKETLAWYDIATSGQQVHIAYNTTQSTLNHKTASRHPCFKLDSPEALLELQTRIWAHYKAGSAGAPVECDEPGGENSGSKGAEYPQRFFCRDFANNRLEFSL